MIVTVIVFAVSEVAGCGLANLSDFFPGVIIISLQLVVVSQPGGFNQRKNALRLALALGLSGSFTVGRKISVLVRSNT